MKLPVLLALISGGVVLIITLVLLAIYIREYLEKNGVKKTLLLIIYILLGVSVTTLYACMWFISVIIAGIITATIFCLMFLYLMLRPW